MGASMRVRWTDGPTEQAVRSVAARYEGSGFDAMQDLKYPLEPTLVAWRDGSMSLVHFGVDTVHVNREISPAYEALLAEHATALVREQTNGRLVFDRQTRYTEPFIDPAGRTIPWPLNGHELLRELSRHIAAPAGAPAARKRKA